MTDATIPWSTPTPARCTWTPSRRNRSSTCCRLASPFSLATAGCNFHCRFCQNWEISQKGPEETFNVSLDPARAAAQARSLGAASIASTYVEPTIFMEYMLELGREAHGAGLLKVMHSNGFVNPEPLDQLLKVLDAACIDLKSASPRLLPRGLRRRAGTGEGDPAPPGEGPGCTPRSFT